MWMTRVFPAATFVVGVVLGGLVVGAASSGGSGSPSEPPQAAAPTATATAPAPETTVVVPGACNQAAEAVTEAVELIRQGAASVRDFDPDELVRVLDELETLEPQARELAARCSDVDVDPGPTTAPTTG